MGTSLLRGAISVAALVCVLLPLPLLAQPVQLDWKLDQRFRIFRDAADEKAFGEAIRTYQARAEKKRGFENLRPKDSRVPLRTHWDEASLRHNTRELLEATSRRIQVLVTRPGAGACAVEVSQGPAIEVPCGQWSVLPVPVSIGSTLQASWRNAAGQVERSGPTSMAPGRVFIVGLGDSYGSGEGAPDIVVGAHAVDDCWGAVEGSCRPAVWVDNRCHRSMLSGQFQAAWDLAQRQDGKTETVFLHFACSGAAIGGGDTPDRNGGLLSKFSGRESAFQVEQRFSNESRTLRADVAAPDFLPEGRLAIAAQMDEAFSALCLGKASVGSARTCDGTYLQPDYVFVSVGGNDIGFGDVLASAVLKDCRSLVKCKADYLGDVASRLNKSDIDSAAAVKEALRNRYSTLDEQMKTLRPKLSVITQYPDALTFMQGNERRWCGDGSQRFAGLLTDLTAVESNAIAGVLWEPLNAAIREYFDTAEEGRNTRWAVARMDYDGQRGRGICTRGWFMSYIDSMKKQGILPALGYERQRAPGGFTSGVAHPNFFGYLAQRRAIIEAIDAAAKRAPNSP